MDTSKVVTDIDSLISDDLNDDSFKHNDSWKSENSLKSDHLYSSDDTGKWSEGNLEPIENVDEYNVDSMMKDFELEMKNFTKIIKEFWPSHLNDRKVIAQHMDKLQSNGSQSIVSMSSFSNDRKEESLEVESLLSSRNYNAANLVESQSQFSPRRNMNLINSHFGGTS